MFGTLPAYGLFCRHVTGLTLQNVRLQTTEADRRHAIVCDDVEEAEIDALKAPFATDAAAMLSLTNARRVAIRNCRPPADTDVFLSLRGDGTESVSVYNNNLAAVETVCDRGQDVAESALIQWSNHTQP